MSCEKKIKLGLAHLLASGDTPESYPENPRWAWGIHILVREVSFSLLLLALLNRTKDRPTPPILASSKRRRNKRKEKIGFKMGYLGMEHKYESLRECELEQSHELVEVDVDQHCISEKYSPRCRKMKKSQEQRNNPKTHHRH